jgi:predicted phage replisome organizer
VFEYDYETEMSEISWIKLDTGIWTNPKIVQIRSLPGGNTLVLLWILLLTVAGRANARGELLLTQKLPYDEKTLANELGFPVKTVRSALDAFERFDMIRVQDGVIRIADWEGHQNLDGMEIIREQNRIRKQKQRDRERDSHVTGYETPDEEGPF